MKNLHQIVPPDQQWVIPPTPLLDEEFDHADDLLHDHEMPLLLETVGKGS